MSKRVFLVAAEASGDALGADLTRALKEREGSLDVQGVGGPLMAGQGVESQADIRGLAILGFVDGLLAYGRVKAAVAATVDAILKAKPDVVVLIDSWGFTLRVAHGSGGGNAPFYFPPTDDERVFIGDESDIAHLIAGALGLKLEESNTSWEGLFLGIDSGQFDLGVSNPPLSPRRAW